MMPRPALRRAASLLGAFLLLATMAAGLAACGKKGSPSAPGPASRITYPRTYPTPD